jgi:hypothetical protein
MEFDAHNYAFDADGNRVLIGLTLEETREFERLNGLISILSSPTSPDDARSQNEKRWLVPHEKHRSASEPFLMTPRTMH